MTKYETINIMGDMILGDLILIVRDVTFFATMGEEQLQGASTTVCLLCGQKWAGVLDIYSFKTSYCRSHLHRYRVI